MIRPRLTRAQRQQIVVMRNAGVTQDAIAKEIGCSVYTVIKWLKRARREPLDPLMRLGIEERAAKYAGIPRTMLRDRQKQVILERFSDLTDEACTFLLELLRDRDAPGFAQAMAGIEKLNKVSGDAAGESQANGSQPVQVTIDLREIIDRVLEKHGDVADR